MATDEPEKGTGYTFESEQTSSQTMENSKGLTMD